MLVTAALAGIVPLGAAPAWAAPTLTVSKTTGLTDGASVTVGGSGFTPNLKQIAVGQCIEEVKGPTDCNLAGGSQFVNADAAGKIPTVTLKLAQKFGTFDCTKRACVIAAQILPSGGNAGEIAANKASVKLTFGAPAQSRPRPRRRRRPRPSRRRCRRPGRATSRSWCCSPVRRC